MKIFRSLYRNESETLGFTFLCPKWAAGDVKAKSLSFNTYSHKCSLEHFTGKW